MTPSYNQGHYVEESLRSVLLQDYENIEHIVVDDGSTDNSLDVIRRYEPWLSHLVTGPNRGNGEAVNAGFQLSTGEIMACLNTDDFYLSGALKLVAQVFQDCPEVEWLAGHSVICDENSRPMQLNEAAGFNRTLFFSGRYLGGHKAWNGRWIPHEAVFIRRSAWDRAGGYYNRARLQYNDFECWVRLWQHAELFVLRLPVAAFRCQPQSFTSTEGGKSLAPCSALLDAVDLPKLSTTQVRLRDLVVRVGNRAARWAGLPARFVSYDAANQKWRPDTVHVM